MTNLYVKGFVHSHLCIKTNEVTKRAEIQCATHTNNKTNVK